MDLDLNGISLMAIIVGLVEVLKAFGIPSKWCLVISIITGVALGALIEAIFQYPQMGPWLVAVIKGLVLGLSATGLYKAGKRFLTDAR